MLSNFGEVLIMLSDPKALRFFKGMIVIHHDVNWQADR